VRHGEGEREDLPRRLRSVTLPAVRRTTKTVLHAERVSLVLRHAEQAEQLAAERVNHACPRFHISDSYSNLLIDRYRL
jgi:hypothetical protein